MCPSRHICGLDLPDIIDKVEATNDCEAESDYAQILHDIVIGPVSHLQLVLTPKTSRALSTGRPMPSMKIDPA